VGCEMCGCVHVWVLKCVAVSMFGVNNVWECVCVICEMCGCFGLVMCRCVYVWRL